jgi:tetratricopeptide (TPR) repeat protein
VAQICARLDGMPLAIELAAARVRALTPEQIAARLDDRFRLLTTGSRTAPQRQHTLEAAIDWSYRLLSALEQALFRRLSVFAGGWTLEAAEAIGASKGIAPEDVLDLLARLVDKSLVVADEAGSEPRCRMLETILAFARARLAESGESDRVARAHLAYFRALAEEIALVLEGWWHQEWLERLEADHGNFRSALGWGLEHAPEDALRATAAVWFLWWRRGHFVEGRRWVERALVVADRIGVTGHTLAELLTAAATFAEHQGEPDATVAYARRGLAVAEENGDVRNTGRLLVRLGDAASQRNQFAEADILFQRVLDLGLQADDDLLRAGGSFQWGLSQLRRGCLDQARLLFEEALRITQARGNESFSLHPATSLAEIALLQGERARALRLIRDGLALAHRLGDKHEVAWLLILHGELKRLDGALEPALETLRPALALARELDIKEAIQSILDGIARVYAAQDRSEEAAWLLGAAEALRDRLEFPLSLAYVPRHEQTVAQMRARLGDERLAAEWARGRAMPLDDAIALAMSG